MTKKFKQTQNSTQKKNKNKNKHKNKNGKKCVVLIYYSSFPSSTKTTGRLVFCLLLS